MEIILEEICLFHPFLGTMHLETVSWMEKALVLGRDVSDLHGKSDASTLACVVSLCPRQVLNQRGVKLELRAQCSSTGGWWKHLGNQSVNGFALCSYLVETGFE